MDFKIECLVWPDDVDVSNELMPEEKNSKEHYNPHKKRNDDIPGPAFHEKKEKNKKTNQGGSYRRELAKKYKKPKTRQKEKKCGKRAFLGPFFVAERCLDRRGTKSRICGLTRRQPHVKSLFNTCLKRMKRHRWLIY